MPAPSRVTLLPYQARWVADQSPLKVCEKSRRIGLSWAEAYDSVLYAGRREGGGDVYYQSYSLDMTRTFVDDCAGWAARLQIAVDAVGETLVDLGGGRSQPAYRLALASGRRIVAMTSAPRGFRSKGRPGDRAIVDEAAFVDDLEQVLKAALAFRMWGGQVHVLSTHNGEGPFAALCRDVRDGVVPGSLHRTPLRDALADGLYRRICDVAGETWSAGAERAWEAGLRAEYGARAAEELDCVPSAGRGAWLSWQLIRAAEHPDAGRPGLAGDGPCWIGVDIARRRDLWALAVVEQVGDVLWLRQLETLRDAPFSEQLRLLAEAVRRWRPVRAAVDQTGMGEMWVEQARQRHGSVVEGVLLTAPRRLDVATALRQAAEDRLLRIPADDALRADLHAMRETTGPTGAPRLAAERDGDGHADRFWALALAVAASADAPPRRYAYEPVGGRRGAGFWDDDWDDDHGRGATGRRWRGGAGW